MVPSLSVVLVCPFPRLLPWVSPGTVSGPLLVFWALLSSRLQHHVQSTVHTPALLVSLRSSSDHVIFAHKHSWEPCASPAKPKLFGLKPPSHAHILRMSSRCLTLLPFPRHCHCLFSLQVLTSLVPSARPSFPPGPPAWGLALVPPEETSPASLYHFTHGQIWIEKCTYLVSSYLWSFSSLPAPLLDAGMQRWIIKYMVSWLSKLFLGIFFFDKL